MLNDDYFDSITVANTTLFITYLKATTKNGIIYQIGKLPKATDATRTEYFNSSNPLVGFFSQVRSVILAIGFYRKI